MAAESATDRLNFLMTDDFAVSATVGANTVIGIFDNEYFPVEMGGVEVASNQPMFVCRTADLPTITLGTTACTVSAVAYIIISDEPDGTGMTTLRLREPS